MKTFINPDPSEWEGLCVRASFDSEAICKRVNAILSDVRTNGDAALRRLSLEIDGVPVESFKVSEAEVEEASSRVPVEAQDCHRLGGRGHPQVSRNPDFTGGLH